MINAYRVCKNNIAISGISTKYHQQCNFLVGEQSPFINPRKKITTDLNTLMKKNQKKERETILTIGAKQSERIEKVSPNLNKIYTYEISCIKNIEKKSKYPLKSSNQNKSISFSLLLEQLSSYFSDHRGIFLDTNLTQLIRNILSTKNKLVIKILEHQYYPRSKIQRHH